MSCENRPPQASGVAVGIIKMRTCEHLSKYRNQTHPQFKTTDKDGMNGFFVIPLSKGDKTHALVIASNGNDSEGNEVIPWEHVSARVAVEKYHGKLKERTPTWDEMCAIKKLFWRDDEVVVQIHPAESEYINLHPHVLHLWKPTKQEVPMPPIEAV